MSVDADLAHDLNDLLAEGRVALPGAILQRLRPTFADETGRHLGNCIHGECLYERHPAR